MKSFVTSLFTTALLAALPASGQVTATLDASKNWIGYMSVFELPANGGAYVFGNFWGTSDLAANFALGSNVVTLGPNTNAYNATDAFWANPTTGLGNKQMEASFFVEDTGLRGQTLNFRGTVESNTLTADYTAIAFIKILDSAAGYGVVADVTAPLVAGESFDLTLEIANNATYIPQYGFTTTGPNAAPGNSFGTAVVGPYVEGDGDGDGDGDGTGGGIVDGQYLGLEVNQGWIDTGNWLGQVYVTYAPWAYTESLGWFWLQEDSYFKNVGAWLYVTE